jgi:hypothetical protein
VCGGGLSKYRVFLTSKTGSSDLCRHVVGRKESQKACCAQVAPGLESCGTAHRGVIVLLEPETFYVLLQKTPTPQIQRAPFLDVTTLTDEFLFGISGYLKTLDEWSDLFTLVKTLGSEPNGPLITESDALALRAAISAPLQTSRRPGGRSRPDPVILVSGEEQGDQYESALDALPSTPLFEAVELLEDPREEILENGTKRFQAHLWNLPEDFRLSSKK